MKWSVVKKKLLHSGFFKVNEFELKHDLFDGGESVVLSREMLDVGHAAAVLPYDPQRDELVLIEQFRIGAGEDVSGPWVIEIIAGLQEPDESSEEVVRREALEEAGCIVTDLIPLYRYYPSPGNSNEQIQSYFARTCTEGLGGIYGVDEEGEDIRVHIVSSQTAFDWLDQGRINSALPILTLQWFRLNKENIQQQWQADK